MIKVELKNYGVVAPPQMITFGAKTCYQAEEPKMGDVMDIVSNLYKPGHHTTLMHSYFTFYIEGIAISDVTLGLHFVSPFYNSSQRSGRFCGKMFADPDYQQIEQYIRFYWPGLSEGKYHLALDFVRKGIEIYQKNMVKAIEVADKFINEERPFASKLIRKNISKYAQEQMRMFISTIFPTALTFTVNLSTVLAMYHSAFSPALKDVTQKMVDLISGPVLQNNPELACIFIRNDKNALPVIEMLKAGWILTKPKLKLVSSGDSIWFCSPEPTDLHPVDLLHFNPKYMNNNVEEIKADIEISIATMGQDQRHRTVRRGNPYFTGNFYLPPIPDYLGLSGEASGILFRWWNLKELPYSLRIALVPYGAMISYRKVATYNAAIHEYEKRLCWSAQEEIFHLALGLREQVIKKEGINSPLTNIFPPVCVRTGRCGEGKRYCGRNIKKDCFVERRV